MMKTHNASYSDLEEGNFLTPDDYNILKGILSSKQGMDLSEVAVVLQKDPRYLLEILNQIDLNAFHIKRTTAAQFDTDFKSGP